MRPQGRAEVWDRIVQRSHPVWGGGYFCVTYVWKFYTPLLSGSSRSSTSCTFILAVWCFSRCGEKAEMSRWFTETKPPCITCGVRGRTNLFTFLPHKEPFSSQRIKTGLNTISLACNRWLQIRFHRVLMAAMWSQGKAPISLYLFYSGVRSS